MNENDLRESVFTYGKSLFKIHDLEQILEQFLRENIDSQTTKNFFSRNGLPVLNDNELLGPGLQSSVLIPGNSKWLDGKVRIKVKIEFTPDPEPAQEKQTVLPASVEIPSVLDDIRKDIEA